MRGKTFLKVLFVLFVALAVYSWYRPVLIFYQFPLVYKGVYGEVSITRYNGYCQTPVTVIDFTFVVWSGSSTVIYFAPPSYSPNWELYAHGVDMLSRVMFSLPTMNGEVLGPSGSVMTLERPLTWCGIHFKSARTFTGRAYCCGATYTYSLYILANKWAQFNPEDWSSHWVYHSHGWE